MAPAFKSTSEGHPMYMIKSGSFYLMADGGWSHEQRDAVRLDKPAGCTNGAPRFVKLRPAHSQDAMSSLNDDVSPIVLQPGQSVKVTADPW